MNKLLRELQTMMVAGLIKEASTTCSLWAQNYINLGKPVPGPLTFKRHPWSKTMHDCGTNWVGMKAAQMAYTAAALNRALYTVDIKRIDVLYILPKRTPDAADFSRTKFDSIIELSPHVKKMFSDVKNIGLKQSGGVNLYIRGAKSESGLKSVSTGLIVFDEFDEIVQKNVALAEERSSGYEEIDCQTIKLSTPTIPGFGISLAMQETDEQHYFFKCPRCSRMTELVYPECLIIPADSLSDVQGYKKSFLQCRECKGKILHEEKPAIFDPRVAGWQTVLDRKAGIPGFKISQLYSTVLEPWRVARSVLKAKQDDNYAQELYNSKLGLPYIQNGSTVTDNDLILCRQNYSIADPPPVGELITMGVDVGYRLFYYEICKWLIPAPPGKQINTLAIKQVLVAGTVTHWNDLDILMQQYQILHAVVDVAPEFREASAFSLRFDGHVNLCRFVRGINKNNIHPVSDSERVVQVNRTSWLDISQNRFRRNVKPGGIILPHDLVKDYGSHVKALVKVTKPDSEGNLKSRYLSTSNEDHFAFASLYADLALPLALSKRYGQDVQYYT